MNIIELLQEPFFLRALAGGTLVASLAAIVGVFVTLRKESFIADAIAHGSLAGVALAFLISAEPLLLAILTAVAMAVLITYLKKHTQLAGDSVIGIIFAVVFAIGVLLLQLNTAYRPELQTFLFGSILAVTWQEVLITAITFVLVTLLIGSFYEQLVHLTFDREAAYLRGVKVNQMEYLINIVAALAIVVSVKVVGIILVTALLVIPATSAKLLARNFSQMIPIALIHNLAAMFIGLLLSINVPPGPVVVLVSGGIFACVFLISKLRH